MDSTLVEADRWSFKPAVATLILVAAIQFFCQLPGSLSFFLIPVSLLGYCISLLVIFSIAACRFIKSVHEEEFLFY
jgi:hypothetical protein